MLGLALQEVDTMFETQLVGQAGGCPTKNEKYILKAKTSNHNPNLEIFYYWKWE